MISSFILCFMMGIIILFFVPLMNNFCLSSVIYAVFLMYLFVRMTFGERKIKGSSAKYRSIFQFVFAIGFCIAFITDLYAERGSMAITQSSMSNSELPFCHIAIPQVLLPLVITKNIIFPARITGHYASVASMLLIWLVCTLILGRGWCSWVCFYGGWEDGMRHVGKKRRLNLLPKNKELREFSFGFFVFIILASICELACVYCKWFCPFKLVTEFSPINSIPSLIAAVIFIGLFLSLVIVMPILTKRRTQCSVLCPFGALASLTDGLSMFQMKIDTDKCKGCMKCAQVCPFGAIDIKTIQDKKGHPEITCAKCGECVRSCPENAISMGFRFDHKCGSETATSQKLAKTKVGKVIQELLEPAVLFRFAAFTFSVVMSSNFMIKALNLIFSAIIK